MQDAAASVLGRVADSRAPAHRGSIAHTGSGLHQGRRLAAVRRADGHACLDLRLARPVDRRPNRSPYLTRSGPDGSDLAGEIWVSVENFKSETTLPDTAGVWSKDGKREYQAKSITLEPVPGLASGTKAVVSIDLRLGPSVKYFYQYQPAPGVRPPGAHICICEGPRGNPPGVFMIR